MSPRSPHSSTGARWTYLNPIIYYDSGGASGRSQLVAWEWNMPEITTKGFVTHKAKLLKPNIIITSYEVFQQDIQLFSETPFVYIALDEAHRLKNKNAKVLNMLKRMPCPRILLLTGTPIQNNTTELFTLLNYIEPEKFGDEAGFMRRFGSLTSKEQVDQLHKLIKPHFLRRMKEDVEDSIPPL